MPNERTPLLSSPPPPPPPWDARRSLIAGVLVLTTLTLERLAFYSLAANLFLLLNVGGWSARGSMTAVLWLVGVAHFSALGGGWLADGLVGRYWALVGGLSLYVLGFLALTLPAVGVPICGSGSGDMGDSHNPIGNCPGVYIYASLVIIGIAAGTVRANFPSFGAEQVKYGGADSLRQFFNWYYWCINIGSLSGVGALSYVAINVPSGFAWSLGAATCCVAIALAIFASGRPVYIIHRPAAGSVLRNICGIVREGFVGRCRWQASLQSSPLVQRRLAERPRTSPNPPVWLDYAKVRYGGSHHDSAVDDVKRLGAVCLLFVCLLPYWLVYFQIETGFQEQGVHLKINFLPGNTTHGFNVPTAWLSLFDQIFILALIPIVNGILYPLLDRRGIRVTLLTRMTLGMFFSVIAASGAGCLEYESLQRWHSGHRIKQMIYNHFYNASDISLLWQLPQYCLVGTAEVFAGVAGLELAYSAAPRPLQGVAMGVFSALEGVGSLLGTALISALSPAWIRQDTQHFQGHLDRYFFLLSGIQAVALGGFIIWLWRRRSTTLPLTEVEETQRTQSDNTIGPVSS